MLKENTPSAPRSKVLFSAAFLGLVLFGVGFAQAQQTSSTTEAEAAAQSGSNMRGIEKSDIRRGQTRVSDADGDGHADAAPVARQADLKKLADELVNTHQPTDENVTQDDQPAASKVDAGNALNGGSTNARAGDPIPDIDITLDQGAGRSSGRPTDGSDPTAEPVPALEPNPDI